MGNLRSKIWKSVLALTLVMSMMVQMVFVSAKSDDDNFGTGNKVINTTSDLNTDIPTSSVGGVPGFGQAAGDGRIWVDKSVTDKEDGAFNVKLSALTQEFTSTKSTISTPSTAADVVFVLDGSGSMELGNDVSDGNKTLNRLEAMIKATNEAIGIIMKANPNNRVSVYLYGYESDAIEVLKADSYTMDTGETDYLIWGPVYNGSSASQFRRLFYLNKTLKDSNGNLVAPDESTVFYCGGATPTQKGVAFGLEKKVKEIESSKDIGERKPYVFLLSDGGATKGHSSWWNKDTILNGTPNLGIGKEFDATGKDLQLNEVTSSLILTSAYMKDRLTEAYNAYNSKNGYTEADTLLYSVGFGTDINGPYTDASNKYLKYAWVGLQPEAINKAIAGIPLWSKDQIWDSAQKQAAENVQNIMNKYVDDAVVAGKTDLLKYKDEVNYNYSDSYSYAIDYAALKAAFDSLAEEVESATKVIQSPVEIDTGKNNSAIYYYDNIGKGMKLDGGLVLSINGGNSIRE